MLDEGQRRAAAEVTRDHPHWLVIWGCSSRLFWGFPGFRVPPGTIVRAPDPESLLTRMREVQASAGLDPRGPARRGCGRAGSRG
jgi:hypothetical protein